MQLRMASGWIFMGVALFFGCSSDSSETEDSRAVGGTQAPSNTGTGGSEVPTMGQTCTDGLPIRQSSAWSSMVTHPATAPEVVWTGTEFGFLWLASEASSGLRPLMFGRASAGGDLLGEPVELGQTSASSHKLIFTGERYVAAWVNGRSQNDPYEGIRIGILSPEGVLAEMKTDIDGTYNSTQIGLAWEPGLGALMTFTRGSVGEGGLFALTIDPDGTVNSERSIDERQISSFDVTYGDGAWGVAFAVTDDEFSNPVELQLLDESGDVYEPEPIAIGTYPLGRVHVAYGQGNYAVVWSRLNDEGILSPAAVLLDGAGEIIGRPNIAFGGDFGVVEDLAVSQSKGFMFSWQGQLEGVPVLGVQVMSALGIPEANVMMDLAPGATYTQSRLVEYANGVALFATHDPSPQPLGYSSEVSLQLTSVEACD